MKQIKTTNITWEQIKKRPEVINAIKVIATLKAQEYILRRLLATKLKVIEEIDEHDKNEFQVKVEEMKDTATENNFQNEENIKEIEGVEWYEKWRRENL